jgi:hypothetical protein
VARDVHLYMALLQASLNAVDVMNIKVHVLRVVGRRGDLPRDIALLQTRIVAFLFQVAHRCWRRPQAICACLSEGGEEGDEGGKCGS